MVGTLNRPVLRNAEASLHWGGPPARVGSKAIIGSLTAISVGIAALSMGIGIIPGLGQVAQVPLMGAAHVADRLRNGTEASDELKYRATYYSNQIFKQLNINPGDGRKATVAEFRKAAELAKRAGNPELDRLYHAPLQKRNKANNESLLTNGGIAVAGAIIPAGGMVAGVAGVGKVGLEATHVAKFVGGTVRAAKTMLPTMAGGMAGGALAKVISANAIDTQSLVEAIHKTMAEAQQQSIDPRQVITPNMLFLLRVEQDKSLAEHIKKSFGNGKKSFHQLDEAEQARVMSAFPVLADAATADAEKIASGVDVQEIAANRVDLSGTAEYALGTERSSFAQRELARRAAAPQTAAQIGPSNGYANMIAQRRAAQLTNGGIA